MIMEEYWNLFLNWLGSLGQRYTDYQDRRYMEKQKLYPRAPRVEDRYANSRYEEGYSNTFPIGYPTEEIVQQRRKSSIFDQRKGAKLYRYIKEPGDTIYGEDSPEYEMLGGALITHSNREASTKRPRGREYETLKRRYRAGEKLAKR